MLNRIYGWLGRVFARARGNTTQCRERAQLADLDDHLLADIGCGQQSAERAAKRKVRIRMLQLPPY
jgi:uncharacterized protein YjiS (DUF1127 family)